MAEEQQDTSGASELYEKYVDRPWNTREESTEFGLDQLPGRYVETTKPEQIEEDGVPPGYMGLQEFGKIKRVFGAGGPGGDAKMANIMGLADQLGLNPSAVADRYEDFSNEVITRDRFNAVDAAMTSGVLAGMVTNPVTTALGIAGYEVLPRVTNALIKYFEDGRFKVSDLGRKYSVAERIPGEASDNEKALGELFDVLFGSIGAMGAGMGTKLWSRFTKDLIGEARGPKSVYVTPEILEKMPSEFSDAWKLEGDLLSRVGITRSDLADAARLGTSIEIPSHAIVYLSDTPWWAAIKEGLHIDPYRRLLAFGTMDEAPRIGQEGPGPRPPMDRGLLVDKIADAMKRVESGGDYSIVSRDGGRGAYQFTGTWDLWSSQFAKTHNLGDGPLPFTPENQDAVAKWKIAEYLDKGYSVEQIAAAWNAGEGALANDRWKGMVGVNASGVRYDVPNHVRKVMSAFGMEEGDVLALPPVTGRQGAVIASRFTRQDMIDAMDRVDLPPEQKNTFIDLMDSMAESWGKTYGETPAAWYEHMFAGLKVQDESALGDFVLQQSAFHGSPYIFDEFTLDHIGTGEGAQAFGWGLYFAGDKEVSEFYREKLSRGKLERHLSTEIPQKKFDEWIDGPFKHLINNKEVDEAYRIKSIAQGALDEGFTSLSDFKDHMTNLLRHSRSESRKYSLKRDIKVIDDFGKNAEDAYKKSLNLSGRLGQLYKVEIPDNNELLDWDKPLGEQSEKVKNSAKSALTEYGIKLKRLGDKTYLEDRNGITRGSFESLTGEGLHDYLSGRREGGTYEEIKEGPMMASKLLEKHGIKGHRYLDQVSRSKGEGTHNYVIYDDNAIKILETYYQKALQDAHGTIVKGAAEILQDLRGIIHLFEKAGTPNYDISTLVEESFHILIHHLQGPDLKVMNDWLGADPDALPTDWNVDQHEQAAKGFQAYLFEGKAPSSKLREIFSRMRRWLLDIYKTIKSFGVELTDEVRGVFDRLVSTAEERENNAIFRMRDEYEISHPKERVLYQKSTMDEYDMLMSEASRRALSKVEERRKKATQRRENAWARQAMDIVREDPVQVIKEEIVKRGGLNSKALSKDYDADTIRSLNRKRRGLVTKTGKLESDIIAEDYGFESQDGMIQSILDGPTLAEAVESQVAYMREEYKAEAEAEALEDLILVIDEEIKALGELTAGTTAKMTNYPAKGIKAVIRRNTGQIKVDEASSVSEYHALKASMEAASRAARVAFNAGRKDEALKQKLRQRAIAEKLRDKRLANVELKKLINDMKRMSSDKSLPWDYAKQIQEQLDPFSFRRRSDAQERKWEEEIKGRVGGGPEAYETFDEWTARLESEGELVNIDSKARRLLSRLNKIPLNHLSMDDIRTIHGVIEHLHHLGTTKGKLLASQKRRDLDSTADMLGKSIMAKARQVRDIGDVIRPSGTEKSIYERFSDLISSVDSEMLPAEILIRMMDGGEDNGPFWKAMKLPVEEAFEKEMRMTRQISEAFTKAFEKVGEKKLKQWAKQKFNMDGFPELLRMMTMQQLIMLVANSYHPDNLKALKAGYGLTDEHIAQARNMLGPGEMALVKDLIDIWKIPKQSLFDTHMTLTGRPLKEVEGTYFPLKFDPALSDKMAEIEANKQAMDFFQDFFPGINVKAGASHERTGGKASPLLTFSWIPGRLQETAHYGTHAVVVRDLLKLLKHPLVKNSILRSHGKPYHDNLLQWLKRVASPRGPEPPLKLEKILDWTRSAQVTYILFWRFSTALQQPFALLNTAAEVGVGPTLSAMAKFMTNWNYWTDYIMKRDENIGNLDKVYDREIADLFQSFDPTKQDWYANTVAIGHVLTGFTDNVARRIGWLAAYQEAMAGRVDGVAALDEEMAIRHASSVVIRTQASAFPKDRSTLMNRNSPVWKTFITFFFTYFNGFYGLLREYYSKARNPNVEYSWLDFLKAMFLTVILGGVGQEIASKGPNTTWKDALEAPFKYPLSTVPFVRDAATVIFDGYDYRGGLAGNLMNEFKRFMQVVRKPGQDKEAKRVVAGLRLMGRLTGLPPDQSIIIMENIVNRRMRGPESMIYRERKKRPK